MDLQQLENWNQTVNELRETETLLQFNLDKYIQTQEITYLEKMIENIRHMLILIPLRNRYYTGIFNG